MSNTEVGHGVKALAEKIITDAKEQSVGWTDTAKFRAVYRYYTWPKGWDTETYDKCFDTREKLDEWIAEMRDQAKCEDNMVHYSIYEWDLGPNLIDEVTLG